MSSHIGLCKANGPDGSGWVELSFERGEWHILGQSGVSLPHIIAGVLQRLKQNPSADFSFTDRTLAEVSAIPFVSRAEDLTAPFGAVSVSVFCPQYDQDTSLWASVWRAPTGQLSSIGKESYFRVQLLSEQIEKWFLRERYASFSPPGYSEAFDPNLRIARPPWARELYVRHDWRARELCPDAFPKPLTAEQIAAREATQRSYQELKDSKNPRLRREKLQAQWEQERKALKASPEERAASELARKIAAGAEWSGPYPEGDA